MRSVFSQHVCVGARLSQSRSVTLLQWALS